MRDILGALPPLPVGYRGGLPCHTHPTAITAMVIYIISSVCPGLPAVLSVGGDSNHEYG